MTDLGLIAEVQPILYKDNLKLADKEHTEILCLLI